MQFISQIVKIVHKIRNCVYITSILSFHYFISFHAILTYHIWSSIRGLLEHNEFITPSSALSVVADYDVKRGKYINHSETAHEIILLFLPYLTLMA